MESESNRSFKYDVFFSCRRKDTRTNIVEHLRSSLSDRGINVYEDNIAEFHHGKHTTILDAMERSMFVIVVISKNYLRSSRCMDEFARIMATDTRRIVIPLLYNLNHMEVFSQIGPLGSTYNQMFHRYHWWKKWLLPLKEASRLAGWKSNRYKRCVGSEVEVVGGSGPFRVSRCYRSSFQVIRDRVSWVDVVGLVRSSLSPADCGRGTWLHFKSSLVGSVVVGLVSSVVRLVCGTRSSWVWLEFGSVVVVSGGRWSSYRQKSNEEIVDTILSGVSSSKANDEGNLIGVEPQMQHIVKDLLEIENRACRRSSRRNKKTHHPPLPTIRSGGVRMIGICGAGGIGKTTLAMAIYNEISCNFGGCCCFIQNVKEDSRKNGLKKLQEKILTDVFKAKDMMLMSIDKGKHMLKKRMARFSVLIVLDDVDDSSQLVALAGERSWFGTGSRIIITSRDKRLLEAHEVDSIHQVDFLKEREAAELFNSFAFPKNKTLEMIHEQNEKLSLSIVQAAGSLPLTLKVLGSFLCDKMDWTSAMEVIKLESTETLKMLKISYNGLDSDEKEIFLDIALFFRNRKKAEVMEILYAIGYQTCDIAINVLISRSLVSISDGRFQVHDLIQELARDIILEDRSKEHGRIWQAEILLKKTEATEVAKIKGIQVKFDDESPLDFSDAFTDMKDLRFLDISISPMSKDRSDDKEPKVLPNNLRWLSWSSYPGKYLPRDFKTKQLVVLCMAHSKLVQLSEKLLDPIPTLKVLDLSGSKDLISIPSFAGFPNLERLTLQNCRNLKLIDASIAYLKRLVSLDMSGCSELQEFPPIVNISSLKFLIFSGCTKLRRFLEIEGNTDSNVISIDIRDCKSLTSTSLKLGKLTLLRSLKVSGCSSLEELPKSLADLQFLEELLVDNTGIRELPAFIWDMPSLKTLSFRHVD
ncbi:hypothetical protein OSB04_030696 [Centaurea solstitialis]|uniref:TIR domain-containing protein n=1 Tax=Centaurea solstitialis TaxID=347529 RepID=A0AA38SFP3_9ASTR|nr:hypothetical protein OSB04_030696 [Centaurea solstitialis]